MVSPDERCAHPDKQPETPRNPCLLSIGQDSGTIENLHYNNVCYCSVGTDLSDPSNPHPLHYHPAAGFDPYELAENWAPKSGEIGVSLLSYNVNRDAGWCHYCCACRGNDDCTSNEFPANGYDFTDRPDRRDGCGCLGSSDNLLGHCNPNGDCEDIGYRDAARLTAKRLKFTGDPIECCFNNFECAMSNFTYDDNNMPEHIYERCFSDEHMDNDSVPTGPPKFVKSFTCSDGKPQYRWNGNSKSYDPIPGTETPNHRNMASDACFDMLSKYCTGTLSTDSYTSSEWLDRWLSLDVTQVGQPKSCAVFLENVLFELSNHKPCDPPPMRTPGVCGTRLSVRPPTARGLKRTSQMLKTFLQHYEANGYRIGAIPGTPEYHPVQEILFNDICCPYPEMCSSFLGDMCERYTLDELSKSPASLAWCGCYLSGDQYESYAVKYNMSKQCTPTCNRIDVIPLIGPGGEPIKCDTDACIMDNITVNITNSTIDGGISFDQVCGSCTGGSCTCIVNDNEIDVINSTIGGHFAPISQNCGALHCNISNIGEYGPSTIVTECLNPLNPLEALNERTKEAKAKANHKSKFYTILIIMIVILILILLVWLLHARLYVDDEDEYVAQGSVESSSRSSSRSNNRSRRSNVSNK